MRFNVELKYQVSVDAKDESEAYEKAKMMLENNPENAFNSHCKKVNQKWK